MSRRRGESRWYGVALGALAALLPAAAAAAQDSGAKAVEIHFSGGWAMGDTDGNDYLGGSEGREYDLRDLAVTFVASPHERLRLNAQVALRSNPIAAEEIETDINFAFAEWAFSDLARLRAGISRQPFGLYSETLEVGTLRPFFSLPQGVYAPASFQSPGYQGLGLSGFRALGSWEWSYDLYAGELMLDAPQRVNPLFAVLVPAAEERQNLSDLVGLRVSLGTPVEGLRLAAGAYEGRPEELPALAAFGVPSDHKAWVASLEWLRGPFELRAETAHRKGGAFDATVDAWYVEAAYRLTPHWQLAGRLDTIDISTPILPLPPPLASLFEHEDWAVGLNWWPSPNLVFKLSYHRVDGNVLAVPDALPDLARGEALERRTDLVQLGVQFSY